MSFFIELRQALAEYLTEEQVNEVFRAYQFAEEAHKGQQRQTGDPYISHPIAVAQILASMRMDHQSIMAAILHDVIEDTGIDKSVLKTQFSEEVAELVDGVSKLTQINFESRAEAQAENFRKMVLAMVRDIRVILVKLADRLHNMRTLDALPAHKRRRIAKETLEIYAPIANRLGMHNFRIELEDLGFAALHPLRYRVLKEAVRRARRNRRHVVSSIETSIKECLEKHSLPPCAVWGREKHLYSIYKKMRGKHKSFSDIMDVYGFRIVVDTVDTCYRVLGAVHNLYKPLPERFKDYVAIPKANGYQSLHTTLFGPYGVPIEIQIRTVDMNNMADNGIAAHWLYKSTTESNLVNEAETRARGWLKSLLEMQRSTGTSLEFIENVKIDLFPDEVYVFTPKGSIMELPKGASAVDFAYAVHSDIGNSCVASKINRRLSPLSTPLKNGQTVEIITAPGARPNPAWLNFVVTGKARSNIRHYLKSQQRAESITLGRRLIEKSLVALSISWSNLSPENIKNALHDLGYKTLDDVCEATALGNETALLVANRLSGLTSKKALGSCAPTPLLIRGCEGVVLKFAECCHPIPGDPIVGYFKAGSGLIIHMEHCRKVTKLPEYEDKVTPVNWSGKVVGDFQVSVRVEAFNQRGVLARLATAIADCNSNIENISVTERDGTYSIVSLLLSVNDRDHLARVMRRVRSVKEVCRVMRRK